MRVSPRKTSWRSSSSDEIREAEDVAGQLAAGAAEDRLHARDDLGEAERLGHVVVAAGAQRLDLVLDRVLRGQEENRRLEALLPQPPADLDAVEVGEHPVEHDEVGLARATAAIASRPFTASSTSNPS